MIQELHDIFPNISEQRIWKLLLTLKFRLKKYGVIGLSRLEASRFGTSERQLQSFINYLKETQAIKKIRMATAQNGFKCNVYSMSQWFVQGLEEVKDYVKRVFISPIEWMKANVTYKKKYGIYKFTFEGNKYIINTKGRFKDKILDVVENKIISIYNLT